MTGLIESELRDYASVPAALLALVATGLLLAGDRLPTTLAQGRTVVRWLAVGVGLYAALTAIVALASDNIWPVLGIVGIGLTPQTLSTAAAAVLTDLVDVNTDGDIPKIAAATIAVWTFVLLVGARWSAPLVLVLGPPIFFPFGVLVGARHRARFFFPFVAALGAVVTALPFVPRVGVVFVTPTVLLVLSGGTALLGIPLFAIGQRFGSTFAAAPEGVDSPRSAAN